MKRFLIVSMTATTFLLSACATHGDSRTAYPSGTYPSGDSRRSQFGYVEETSDVDSRGGGAGGAIVGGIIGGVIGHQIGGGRGNTAATIAGAAGGALIGNEVEKGRSANGRIQVRVRLDNGDRITYTQENPRDFRAGDRVRIQDGRVFPG